MYIAVTIETKESQYNISTDERQRISAVYSILPGQSQAKGQAAPRLFKSALLGEWVPAEKTFKEQGIVNGDRLTAQQEA